MCGLNLGECSICHLVDDANAALALAEKAEPNRKGEPMTFRKKSVVIEAVRVTDADVGPLGFNRLEEKTKTEGVPR